VILTSEMFPCRWWLRFISDDTSLVGTYHRTTKTRVS